MPDPIESPKPDNAKTSPWLADQLATASSIADSLGKIQAFVVGFCGALLAALLAGYDYAKGVIEWIPRPLVILAVGGSVVVMVILFVASWKVRKASRGVISLFMTCLAVLFGCLAAICLCLLPSKPEWTRLNVPNLVLATGSDVDLPISIIFKELVAANGMMPGGDSFEGYLIQQRKNILMQQNWVAFYAPEFYPSTLPRKFSLRETGSVTSKNALLGLYLFRWSIDGNRVRVSTPTQIGFDKPTTVIENIPALRRDEHAAIVLFVYPLTLDASRHLSLDLNSLLDVRN